MCRNLALQIVLSVQYSVSNLKFTCPNMKIGFNISDTQKQASSQAIARATASTIISQRQRKNWYTVVWFGANFDYYKNVK